MDDKWQLFGERVGNPVPLHIQILHSSLLFNKTPSQGLKSWIYTHRQFWLYFGCQLILLNIVDTAGP